MNSVLRGCLVSLGDINRDLSDVVGKAGQPGEGVPKVPRRQPGTKPGNVETAPEGGTVPGTCITGSSDCKTGENAGCT